MSRYSPGMKDLQEIADFKALPLRETAREQQADLEELQAAPDEVQQQNEELIAIREILEAERHRYQDLFNFAPDAYLLTDAAGEIQEANYAAATLLNIGQQSLIGENLIGFVAEEERQSLQQRLKWLSNKLYPVQEWEVRMCPCNGEFFDAGLRVGTFRYRGRKSASLRWLVRDITAHKQALQQEKELNELKSRFISIVSHEFRTPLSTILSSSELLQYYGHQFSDEKKQNHLGKIQTQVKQMNQLLEDVLFIGKAEAGRISFTPERSELSAFCREILEEISLIDRKKHSFTFEYRGECSTVEMMDEKLLRSILANLLNNAAKYSPQGSTVHLNLICENDQAIFQIRDEGVGIPASEQSRIFEVFHRASNVGNIPGTGLGMAIVKQAVELHGGSIAFESEEGVGTTFTVCIPTIQQP